MNQKFPIGLKGSHPLQEEEHRCCSGERSITGRKRKEIGVSSVVQMCGSELDCSSRRESKNIEGTGDCCAPFFFFFWILDRNESWINGGHEDEQYKIGDGNDYHCHCSRRLVLQEEVPWEQRFSNRMHRIISFFFFFFSFVNFCLAD